VTTYSHHRNHASDGLLFDNCYWCQTLVIQPALREKRKERRKSSDDSRIISLDEFTDLAADEAA
jgi:hypothetical protein